MKAGGGSDDLVLVLGRTQKTVKTFLKKMLCWEQQMVLVGVKPLDIFACWCTYPCISPFV